MYTAAEVWKSVSCSILVGWQRKQVCLEVTLNQRCPGDAEAPEEFKASRNTARTWRHLKFSSTLKPERISTIFQRIWHCHYLRESQSVTESCWLRSTCLQFCTGKAPDFPAFPRAHGPVRRCQAARECSTRGSSSRLLVKCGVSSDVVTLKFAGVWGFRARGKSWSTSWPRGETVSEFYWVLLSWIILNGASAESPCHPCAVHRTFGTEGTSEGSWRGGTHELTTEPFSKASQNTLIFLFTI
jgi:hypothetical protein